MPVTESKLRIDFVSRHRFFVTGNSMYKYGYRGLRQMPGAYQGQAEQVRWRIEIDRGLSGFTFSIGKKQLFKIS